MVILWVGCDAVPMRVQLAISSRDGASAVNSWTATLRSPRAPECGPGHSLEEHSQMIKADDHNVLGAASRGGLISTTCPARSYLRLVALR
ncbi:hypothetical protein RHA1_ro05318 [Rhodococcus jostii RHA1]|uniref:Uncharacterized protein n=1 Tax=Rhodococcus jostii (strain RHA1) TaxID=101510 RepID=Q0S5T7_RHOJR|nr:hypothetical protein RHA1_ro05318 [Rhodococcus jostii RHA1]